MVHDLLMGSGEVVWCGVGLIVLNRTNPGRWREIVLNRTNPDGEDCIKSDQARQMEMGMWGCRPREFFWSSWRGEEKRKKRNDVIGWYQCGYNLGRANQTRVLKLIP